MDRGETFSAPAQIMKELEAMGLVILEKKPSIQLKEDGKVEPSSVLQAAVVLPTTTAEKPKKRKYTKKQK